VVLDLHFHAIVGWAMRERMDGKLVMDALGMALGHHPCQGKHETVLF
jgi:transposase InsO family protein